VEFIAGAIRVPSALARKPPADWAGASADDGKIPMAPENYSADRLIARAGTRVQVPGVGGTVVAFLTASP